MKKYIKIALVTIILLGLSAGGYFAIKFFTTNNVVINDMFVDEFSKDTNALNEDTTLDDILGDDVTSEDMAFLNSDPEMFKDSTMESDALAMKSNELAMQTNVLALETNTLTMKSNEMVVASNKVNMESNTITTSQKTMTEIPRVKNNTAGQFEKEDMTPYVPAIPIKDPVRLSAIILNYNDKLVTSRSNPILVTVVLKAPEEALFTSIRVYARRLSRNNEILSRTPVFRLPKIYVVDGQAQTQFYFSGRTTQNTFLPSGRYLLYVEAQVTDKLGNHIGNTGRYPLPQWKQVITIK